MNREDLFNETTIIKNDIYDSLKDLITCSICSKLFFEPKMCMICQSSFCNKCLEEWSKNEKQCPSGCENPEYHDSIEKNNLLSKISFKCIKNCGKVLKFKELKEHYEINCTNNNNNEENKNEESNDNENKNDKEKENKENFKFEILTKEQAEELRKEGNEVNYITSK